jgi:putative phosphoesterase
MVTSRLRIVIEENDLHALHPSKPIDLRHARILGVISDTHVPHRMPALPQRLFELLKGCDAILHAGDLESTEILPALNAIAPTHAVRGNLHWQFSTGVHDQDLPLALTLRARNHVIWMTHGHISFTYSVLDKMKGFQERRSMARVNEALIARMARMKPANANIVIFGHSHLSCATTLDGTLYFNPGAVSASAERKAKQGPRIGLMHLCDDGTVEYEWKLL